MPFDFPDFLPTDRPSNIQLGNIDQIVTSTVFVTNLDTTPYNEVVLYGNNEDITTYMKMSAAQFGAPGDPVQTLTYQMALGPQQFGSMRIPISRGILQTTVQNFGGIPTNHYQAGVYGVSSHINIRDLFSSKPEITMSNDALAANANVAHVIPTWYTGPVEVSAISDSSGPARLLFQYFDPDSLSYVTFNFFGVGTLFGSTITRMTFPQYPVKYTVFNGATAQNVEVSICASDLNGI